LDIETDLRLAEAEAMGVGFTVAQIVIAPIAPRNCEKVGLELLMQAQ
jgi:hypothetical protein